MIEMTRDECVEKAIESLDKADGLANTGSPVASEARTRIAQGWIALAPLVPVAVIVQPDMCECEHTLDDHITEGIGMCGVAQCMCSGFRRSGRDGLPTK